jgi:hypothetical protein
MEKKSIEQQQRLKSDKKNSIITITLPIFQTISYPQYVFEFDKYSSNMAQLLIDCSLMYL